MLYPFLNNRKISFRPIARITVGFITVIAAMAYAAVVQHLIYNAGPCYDQPLACLASDGGRIPNNVNVWLQTPIYVILAFAEIFSFVTASEYAYAKAPKDMKAIVQSMTQLTAGVGAALGMAISPVAKDPKLVIMYGALGGAMCVVTMLFWWRFKKYDHIDEELDMLDVKKAPGTEVGKQTRRFDEEKSLGQ
jgi:POT family proton-dependent oligopeptide transporter